MSIPDSETVLLVTRNGMGDAEPDLQQKLISTYLGFWMKAIFGRRPSVSTPTASISPSKARRSSMCSRRWKQRASA